MSESLDWAMSDRDNLYRELVFALKQLHAMEAILTDLIAELRERHPAGEYCCCGWCDRDWKSADCAEARLKGLNDE